MKFNVSKKLGWFLVTAAMLGSVMHIKAEDEFSIVDSMETLHLEISNLLTNQDTDGKVLKSLAGLFDTMQFKIEEAFADATSNGDTSNDDTVALLTTSKPISLVDLFTDNIDDDMRKKVHISVFQNMYAKLVKMTEIERTRFLAHLVNNFITGPKGSDKLNVDAHTLLAAIGLVAEANQELVLATRYPKVARFAMVCVAVATTFAIVSVSTAPERTRRLLNALIAKRSFGEVRSDIIDYAFTPIQAMVHPKETFDAKPIATIVSGAALLSGLAVVASKGKNAWERRKKTSYSHIGSTDDHNKKKDAQQGFTYYFMHPLAAAGWKGLNIDTSGFPSMPSMPSMSKGDIMNWLTSFAKK